MIKEIVKYAAIVGATAAITISAPKCYESTAYSGLNPSQGFPAWGRAKELRINHANKGETLETYLQDGSTMIPVYEREGKIMVGKPEEECGLFTPEEKEICIAAYKQTMKDKGMEQNGVGQWIGGMMKQGKDLLDETIDGIKEGYVEQPSTKQAPNKGNNKQ